MRGPNGYKVVGQGLQQMKVSVALYTRCSLLHLLLTDNNYYLFSNHMVIMKYIPHKKNKLRSTLRYPKQTHPQTHPTVLGPYGCGFFNLFRSNLEKKGFPPLRRRVRSGIPARKQVKTIVFGSITLRRH